MSGTAPVNKPAIHLQVLGGVAITVGDRALDPDATHVFAALLIVALQPKHRVARQRLAALLWDDAPEHRRAQRLRWLLSKMRGIGVPLDVSPTEVGLSATVSVDAADMVSRLKGSRAAQLSNVDEVDEICRDYRPGISPAFERWLDERRDNIGDELIAWLVPVLGDLRHQAQWALVTRVARAILRVSAMHDEATLALAESLCATGDKGHGLKVLNDYLATIRDEHSDLRIPAELLRRRITASTAAMDSSAPAFVGRREQLRRFDAMLASAKAGRGSALLVAGPPGIGKTRLLDEAAAIATSVGGATVVRARCQPGDALRPLAVLTDVVPQLLELPGAAGCSPETLQRLARLGQVEDGADSTPTPLADLPGLRRSELLAAVSDLIAATSDEKTLVIQIDDFQWSDRRLDWLWSTLLPFTTQHRVLWCLAARCDSAEDASALFRPELMPLISREWLAGLDTQASRELLTDMLSQRHAEQEERDALLARGGGIPLVLIELVRHWASTGDTTTVPGSLAALMEARIGRLAPGARRTLQVSALLGTFSTVERLERILQLPRPEFVDALAELESTGILTTDGLGATQGHILWADASVKDLEPSVARVLHRHIAEQFDAEMASTPAIAVLWESARHWHLAGWPDRALAAMQRGADHLARNGLYAEAAEVYDRAIAQGTEPAARLALLRRQIPLLRVAGMVRRAIDAVEQHERLAAAIDPRYDRHNDMELLLLRLREQAGAPPSETAARALACARDERAPSAHRLYASALAIRYADDPDVNELAEVYAIMTSMAPVTDDDYRRRAHAEVFYLLHRRDPRAALTVAQAWAAREATLNVPYERVLSLRMLHWTALTAGEIALSFRAACDAVTLAHEARVDALLMAAYDSVFAVCADYYEPHVFREWLERARPSCERLERDLPQTRPAFDLQEIELLLMEGRGEEALARMSGLPHVEGRVAQSRLVAFPLAARMLLDKSGVADADMRDLAERLAAFFDVPATNMGFPAAVYAEWLDRYESAEAADAFVERFMRDIFLDVVPPRRLAPFVERVRKRARESRAPKQRSRWRASK